MNVHSTCEHNYRNGEPEPFTTSVGPLRADRDIEIVR